MLARMNGFRVTILVLFTLTVALMAYAVTVVIPARQEQYEVYRTLQKSNEYQQRNAEHRARMEKLGPDVEAPEVETARSEAEESERKRQQEINEAEENSVLAAARRKEEERAARDAAEEAAAPAVLGRVTSYNAEWTSILFTPEGNAPLNDGFAIDVYRGKQLVCEAVVDGRDEESGQVSAAVKPVILSARGGAPVQQLTPEPGDTVVASSLMTDREDISPADRFGDALRQMEQGGLMQQVAPQAADAVQQAAGAVQNAAEAVMGAAEAVSDAVKDGVPALEPIPGDDDDDMPAEGSTPAAGMPVQPTQLPAFPTPEKKDALPEIEARLVPVP